MRVRPVVIWAALTAVLIGLVGALALSLHSLTPLTAVAVGQHTARVARNRVVIRTPPSTAVRTLPRPHEQRSDTPDAHMMQAALSRGPHESTHILPQERLLIARVETQRNKGAGRPDAVKVSAGLAKPAAPAAAGHAAVAPRGESAAMSSIAGPATLRAQGGLVESSSSKAAPAPPAASAALATLPATASPTATPTAPLTPTETPRPTATPSATPTANVMATATAQAVVDAAVEAQVVDQLTHSMLLPQYVQYTVQPGDTVASIARRFHDVAWLIRRRNGGLWNMAPGQSIRVWQWPFGQPYYATRTVQTDHPQFYTIKPSDTLGGIAGALRTDAGTLATENGLGSGSLIYAGQTLVLHHYTAVQQRTLVPGVPAERLHTGLLLTDVANLVGTDAALVKGLSWHESGWRMVRGSSGEIGMMQMMPYMASWVQRALIGYKLDPHVPVNNALEGTLLLQYYLDMTHGDTHAALALYHSGNSRSNNRNGSYIRPIMSLRAYFYHYPRAGW